eukprot:TRINITY_DN65336_c0_g1_i1.p1 TRINITY_DN65336_c0_g1~~TRINITY_DN65336_c0_g1_i1.p1  ORF type:complete len:377 (+),score=44.93 TRINITY_DN65336_c0_g1_i1:127-1257(+)
MAPEPDVVGCGHAGTAEQQASTSGQDAQIPTAANALSPQRRCLRCASALALVAAIVACQFLVYFSLPGYCRHFETDTFQRLLWLSPLYLFGPYSAAALVAIFLLDKDRYQSSMFLHRWTWRFALCNLLASVMSPFGEILRDCSETLEVLGKICEVVWVLAFAASQIILLAVVRFKVQALSRGVKMIVVFVWFDRMLAGTVLMLSATFFPMFVWRSYVDTMWRLAFALCFIFLFIVCTCLAFYVMHSASSQTPSASLTWKPVMSFQFGTVADPVRWTRWTAFATLCSMSSTAALQVSLFVWMYNGYHVSNARVVADWIGAFDFILNALCAACMSGMIGPQGNLALVETSFDQVGLALLQREMQEDLDAHRQSSANVV